MNGSINARFALNPESITSEEDVILTLNRLGLDRGRALAALPNDSWEDSLRKHSKTLSTRTQALIENELQRLRGQLLSVSLRYDSAKAWDFNARDAISKGNISAAISLEHTNPPLISLKALTEDVLESISPRSAPLRASVEIYKEAIHPLLMTAQSVHYVDPYFDLTKNHYIKVFAAIFDMARSTKTRHWFFYTRHNVKSSSLEKDIQGNESVLREFLPSGHTSCVNFFDDSSSDVELHQRVIFTKHSGLEFQVGLQHRPSKTYPVSRIPTSLRDSLNRQFVHHGHTFKRKHYIVVESD